MQYIIEYIKNIEYKEQFNNIYDHVSTIDYGKHILKGHEYLKYIYYKYEQHYTYDNFVNILLIYGLFITIVSIWLLRIENNRKTINIYLENVNDTNKTMLKRKDDVKYLTAHINFLKTKLDTISEIVDNTDERVCKKLALIRSEIIKKFSSPRNLQIKN